MNEMYDVLESLFLLMDKRLIEIEKVVGIIPKPAIIKENVYNPRRELMSELKALFIKKEGGKE